MRLGHTPVFTPPEPVLVLARDPAVLAAVQAASHRLGRGPAEVLGSGREALARLTAPGAAGWQVLCEPAAAGGALSHLLATTAEPSLRARVILVSNARDAVAPAGHAALPADGARLAEAIAAPAHPVPLPPEGQAAALEAGLSNGEIAVHYQPVVRMRDRLPVMVEALARWHRPPTAIAPDSFVPLAERAGLMRQLSDTVARHAARDLGPLWQRLRLGVSLNLPLGLLLQPDLPGWLARSLHRSGLRARQLSIELTESSIVHDRSTLRRALVRLREAGHRVLLDDLVLRDDRDWLFGLPFAGFKLDRSLVESLPASASARRDVRRIVGLAEASGRLVVAEGVSDRRLWSIVQGLGVHHAQGFLVGRPLPAAALPAWSGGWRGRAIPRSA